ncbi:hypothetical protein LXA43DRAFT_869862, partial [Ganoderma leucocontextum]
WSEWNVKDLVGFLVERKAKAGDGASFKKATFKEAAADLARRKYKGPEKKWETCKNKWSRVHFRAVQELKKASGFSYSDKEGAEITAEMEQVWEAFVKVCAGLYAKPFKNKGWPYYEDMVKIMPVKAKGGNV